MFPFQKGIAAIVIKDGNEHNTIQYAKDGVNFEIAAITSLLPIAGGPYISDAFTNTKNGRGITWGNSHKTFAGDNKENFSILMRFDCDLSQDIHDPEMKRHSNIYQYKPDFYYKHKLSTKQMERIETANESME